MTERNEPRNKKITTITMSKRVDQSLHDFVNGVVDVSGGVVGHFGLHAGRQFFFDLLQLDADALDHVDGVRVRQNPDAHENSFLPGEPDFGVVIFGAKHNVGDVAEPNERVLCPG